jgi:hypothetical protein
MIKEIDRFENNNKKHEDNYFVLVTARHNLVRNFDPVSCYFQTAS